MTRKRKATIAILAASVLTASSIALWQRALVALGTHLVSEDSLQPADAVAVLLGSFPDRALEAVELYRGGFAPVIVLTRGQLQPGHEQLQARGVNVPEAHDLNRMVLEQEGIPAEAVAVLATRANSTRAEAKAIVAYMREHRLRSVILVTSRYHSGRAAQLLRETAGPEITVISKPTRFDDFDPHTWWRNRTAATFVFLEYAKIVFKTVEPLFSLQAAGVALGSNR